MRQAIYAGSFDPITNGHIDVIKRAQRVFTQLYIAVIQNPEKDSFFSIEERLNLIKDIFKDHDTIVVEGFDGLLVEYAKARNVTTLIRGLRAVSDFEYEFQMSHTNRALYPDMDTVFFMTDTKHAYLSSSLIKQLAQFNGDISAMVPENVKRALEAKR
ncbi:pantetheine-phosphate adenylyltransferase [Candidatus Marinamargulisbacteria bacterium SCGC AG-439-L15]|nr:pantetheine-phosphate adenylyltransferase [Candidatus Marinamargulisbacteria bacterium SCGC AG-439-L15]